MECWSTCPWLVTPHHSDCKSIGHPDSRQHVWRSLGESSQLHLCMVENKTCPRSRSSSFPKNKQKCIYIYIYVYVYKIYIYILIVFILNKTNWPISRKGAFVTCRRWGMESAGSSHSKETARQHIYLIDDYHSSVVKPQKTKHQTYQKNNDEWENHSFQEKLHRGMVPHLPISLNCSSSLHHRQG